MESTFRSVHVSILFGQYNHNSVIHVAIVSESEFFVGMNGTVEQLLKQTEQTGQKGSAASSGKLRRLGFLVYDKSTGFITSHGSLLSSLGLSFGLVTILQVLSLRK